MGGIQAEEEIAFLDEVYSDEEDECIEVLQLNATFRYVWHFYHPSIGHLQSLLGQWGPRQPLENYSRFYPAEGDSNSDCLSEFLEKSEQNAEVMEEGIM